MGKTGISVIMGPEDARKVSLWFTKDERYLKDLIQSYVPSNTRKSTDEMDYRELLHYGYVIKGVAEKILRGQLEEKIKKIEQLSLF